MRGGWAIKYKRQCSGPTIASAVQRGESDVRIPTQLVPPAVMSTHLANLEIRATTRVPITSTNKNARVNIQLSVKELDGLTIAPGQVFSFNKHLGKREMRDGYRSAPVLLNGRRAEDIGGGICVVSTTTFQSFAKANLEIVERHPHSSEARYASAGLDAAVSWGSLDLKVRNNTGGAVIVRTKVVAGPAVEMTVLGQPLPSPSAPGSGTDSEGQGYGSRENIPHCRWAKGVNQHRAV